jgi:diadenosine tetraphosphate (Ap4A) HIT family hydrolase
MTESEEDSTRSACPLCPPRGRVDEHWIEVAALSVSTLYLDRNQTYRGQCALAFDPRHVEGLEQLTREEFHALCGDLHVAAHAVSAVCKPRLMNYASLGNVVPHLHWHIVPRYRSDPRWGGPIYTTTREEMHEVRLDEAEYEALVAALRAEVDRA